MNNLGQYPLKQSEKTFEILFIKDLMRLLGIYHYEAYTKHNNISPSPCQET